MEKLDFTPEEYRAWREGAGLGWPPQSMYDFIGETIACLKAEYGYTDEDFARMRRRWSKQIAQED